MLKLMMYREVADRIYYQSQYHEVIRFKHPVQIHPSLMSIWMSA